MNISADYYNNSLARHQVDYFSKYFDGINQKYNQLEGVDVRVTKLIAIVLKTTGFTLDIITAPIRLPVKATGMLYSKFFNGNLAH